MVEGTVRATSVRWLVAFAVLATGCSLLTDLDELSGGGGGGPSGDAGPEGSSDGSLPSDGSGSDGAIGDAGLDSATNDGATGSDGGCTTTPFRSPTLAASGAGDVDEIQWTNPSGALGAGDGNLATAALTVSTDKSRRLLVRGFGFTIPAGATIADVTVEITRYGADHDDEELYLASWSGAGAPSLGLANRAADDDWPITSTAKTYPGGAVQWGKTLDPGIVNSADFAVAFTAHYKGAGGGTANVDGIRVSVRYCE